ncbi:hypothetical protein SynMEDNS5_01772 [Synechococcus sp. MEDNS5]|nr:hypothetical protein SynMEDNS5_01772 [Synechococcus sp. MEDNS5]
MILKGFCASRLQRDVACSNGFAHHFAHHPRKQEVNAN